MNTKKPIDVPALLSERRSLEKAVETAQTKFSEAQLALGDWQAKTKDRLAELVAGGATSGDPLTDEILAVLGIKSEALEKIPAFSHRLESAKGAEFVIVFHGTERTMFGGPESGDERVPVSKVFFGILSGERVRLRMDGKKDRRVLAIDVPYRRYIEGRGNLFGWVGTKVVPKEGPLALIGSGFALDLDASAMAFVAAVLGSSSTKGKTVEMFLGDEIDGSAGIRALGLLSSELDLARAALHEPTPAEKTAGAGI